MNFEELSSHEEQREIRLSPLEMIHIANAAKGCVDLALQHEWAIVADRGLYFDIPHNNERRTEGLRLDTQDIQFTKLDIDLPRKDDDLRIKITAHCAESDLPNRTITFTETSGFNEAGFRDFRVDDSHNLLWAHYGRRPVTPLTDHKTVAQWLYAQAGLSEKETKVKLKKESDPIRNACDLLSSKAEKLFNVRQIKLDLNPDLEFHAQLLESHDPVNPTERVLERRYAAWINMYHTIGSDPVTERLLVEFSPDDLLLGSDMSTISSARVSLETSSPAYNIGRAIAQQAVFYENDEVYETFMSVQRKIQKIAASN